MIKPSVRMKKILLCVLLCLNLQLALACSCVLEKVSLKMLVNTEAVFTGEAVNVKTKSDQTGSIIEFKIAEVFKGINTGLKSIFIETPPGGGSCGLPVEKGQQWIIWAYRNNAGDLTSNICTQSKLLFRATDDIKLIKSFKEKQTGFWYNGDQLLAKGKLLDGKPNGQWEFYNQENKIQEKGRYLNGVKDGTWTAYQKLTNGEMVKWREERFEKGVQIWMKKYAVDGKRINFYRFDDK